MTASTPRSEPTPASPLDSYDPDKYPRFAVTVDIVILTVTDGELEVLLVERGVEPFLGRWALPGGFKKPDETLDDAARRELLEETGVPADARTDERVEPPSIRVSLTQFGAYGDPDRDPRMNVVSVGYLAVMPHVGEIEGGSDASRAKLWPVSTVLGGEPPLAFDHRSILTDAVERARNDLETTNLATAFVGPAFTLSEFQSVYEAVWDEPLDTANFRRSLQSLPSRAATTNLAFESPPAYVVREVEKLRSGPKGGRPARLFRAGEAWDRLGPPVRRPRRRTDDEDDTDDTGQ